MTDKDLKLKLLIVEDSEMISGKYCDWLKNLSHEERHVQVDIDVIGNGLMAVEHFEQAIKLNNPYQAVVLDHQLPGMNGSEVFSKLKELEKKYDREGSTYIIVATTNTNQHLIVRLLKQGADHYLIKPLEEDHFVDIIGRYFEKEH